MFDNLTVATGDLILAASSPEVTDCRVGGADCDGGTPTEDQDAGGYILALIEELSWLRGAIATVGALAAFFLIGKWVIGKFKGQGSGQQGGLGQVVAGLAALALAFNPEFVAGIVDVVIRAIVNVGNFLFSRVD